MNIYYSVKQLLFSCFFLVILTQLSHASVILIGTRVIYPEDKKFVNLNFRSSDRVPSVIDAWVSNTPISASSNNDAPFIITPSIFRIDPSQGQSVKLIYTGDRLIRDRESVFYLNFVQLPATEKNVNKLLITYKSTVKIFYRPNSLKQNIDNISSFLELDLSKLNSGIVTILNNSEYHITPTNISLEKNNNKIISVSDENLNMIPPFSHEDIKVPAVNNMSGISSYISLINDLGGISTYRITSI
ncbi:molecular chaperone [Providencia burhodogranariea]|uniref:Pili assembly chaperone n=1 Tax=Providencia burhodogranariea DSM 19968 TaxID=1141662 RepID=K8WY83_9GAMM|nr:pili assembly chaperone [Providencia burhodogranariea DSM 19968]